ncbi:MAG: glycosyltransferase [Bryobacteraceae bacterium]|nr:glycosyltransferase [Bryobacteraceae bacterium]MDW8379458.1 glycosyltransferase [Bryobacterales bacterium]
MPSVLLLTTGLATGGAEAQVVLLAKSFQERGWRVGVVSLLPPQSYVAELEAARIEVTHLGMRRGVADPRALWRLKTLLRRFGPDIVHSHMVHANLAARLVRLFCPFPVLVCTAHSMREGGLWRELAYRLTDWLSEATTNVSLRGLRRYQQRKLIGKAKGFWIPNGLDLAPYTPDAAVRNAVRQKEGWQNSFVWLAVGNLREPKDYPTMLQAFARVVQHRPGTRLAVAGSGPLKGELEELSRQLGINRSVQWLGARSDVPELLQGADAFVMSSLWEGTPMALLEASAAGLPAVAPDVGGIGEVMVHRETGLLTPPADPESLARAMIEIQARSSDERRQMGENARQRVSEIYSIQKVIADWEQLFQDLLKRRAAGSAVAQTWTDFRERGWKRG